MISPQEVFSTIQWQGDHARWTVPGDLPYLQGHFPDSPILPAIAIIDASTVLLQRATQRAQVQLEAVTSAKFMSPIVPGQKLRIEVSSSEPTEWRVEWLDEDTHAKLASLQLTLPNP
jgi:3-hydroxymyristoyl/3-hydroxydecanoyl-(acyl carrier protein) dehydratase